MNLSMNQIHDNRTMPIAANPFVADRRLVREKDLVRAWTGENVLRLETAAPVKVSLDRVESDHRDGLVEDQVTLAAFHFFALAIQLYFVAL